MPRAATGKERMKRLLALAAGGASSQRGIAPVKTKEAEELAGMIADLRGELAAQLRGGRKRHAKQKAPKRAKAPTRMGNGVMGGLQRDLILKDRGETIRFRMLRNAGALIERKVAQPIAKGVRRPGITAVEVKNQRESVEEEIRRRTKKGRKNLKGEEVAPATKSYGYSRRLAKSEAWDIAHGRRRR